MAGDVLRKPYTIVYSLNEAGNTGLLLPQAYIVDVKADGTPGYIKAQANPATLPGYGLDDLGHDQEELLEFVDQLSFNNLESYFNRNKKKKISLIQLFEDSTTQKIVRQYIDNKLGLFMDKVKAQEAFLCLNLERKIPVSERLLRFSHDKLKPGLFFSKTVTGINYTLDLRAEEVYIPSQNKIRIITDNPGRIIIHDTVFTLQNINANKITPFLTKDKLFIPDKNVREFFDKFLRDVLLHADIETEGFEVEVYDRLDEATLKYVYDFMAGIWVLELGFRYQQHSFICGEKTTRRTKIEFGEADGVHVFQIRRNFEAEAAYEIILQQAGLFRNASGRFQLQDGKKYSVFYDIAPELLKDSLRVSDPVIDGKKIIPAVVRESVKAAKKGDWFELKGGFLINGINYPVSRFYRNILESDPFFRLQDGTYVILPDTLLATYKDMAVFGSSDAVVWKIPKTHFTLIEQLMDNDIDHKDKYKDLSPVKFSPSDRLHAELRPYQIEGAAWMYRHYKEGLGACLADDMGLGKTLQTLAVLTKVKDELKQSSSGSNAGGGIQLDLFQMQYAEERSPLQALIVLPASLVFNWENEIRRFAPSLMVCRHIGAKRHKKADLLRSYDVLLTSYQTLYSDAEIFRTMHFRFVILDESQYIKNRNSRIFALVNALQADGRISLSGTPLENSLADLWSQMEFINKHILKSYRFFKEHFQIPIEQKKDPEAILKLRSLVQPYILRRTKQQVAPDLPALMEQHVFCEMNEEHRKAYETEKSAARNYLLGLDRAEAGYRLHVFTLLQRLRRMACNPGDVLEDWEGSSSKMEMLYYKLDEVLKADKKLLVFSTFHAYLDDIADYLIRHGVGYRMLTGDTAVKDRGRLVNDFQCDPDVKIFLISLKAGGTGLNLTEADYVFIIDPWWNPFAENQAISRAHRIGREKPVFVLRFITKDTIEDKILSLQREKLSVSEEIIQDNDMPGEIIDKAQYLLE
ncbi:MAG: hypothetical protein IPM26_15025 [Saprospiraceae bacterium]|nr:hypothetical protein [Saprospiraceae bacterium]